MMNSAATKTVVMNCRTCTRACKQYKSLQDEFEVGSDGISTVATMLNYCSNLSFEPQDGSAMPQHICINCFHLLEQSYNFKRMVVDSDELLRLGLGQFEDNHSNHATPAAAAAADADAENENETENETETETETENGNAEIEVDEVVEVDSQGYMIVNLMNDDPAKSDICPQEVAAVVEAYSDSIQHSEQDELIVEDPEADDVCDDDTLVINSMHDMNPNDGEYATVKSECDTQEDEDEIEIDDSPQSQCMEQIFDQESSIVITNVERIDEVIGDAESEDILEIENEEHLIPDDSDDCEEDFLDDAVEDTASQEAPISGEILPHTCKVCHKAFRQQCRLNQHMRSHINDKLFTCETCGKKLKHLRNYKEHMLTHTDAKPHQCLVCQRFYRTTSSLAAHMRTHSADKPYRCEQCGRSYSAYDHLRRHKLTHTGERPYACDLCDKAYYDSSSLRQHKLSHTGTKAFTCEICGVGLSQKSGYKKHMLVHSGEKPHNCPICGRAFTFTSNLNAHVRLHSGEKPFKCDKCMKAFPTKKRLNSHLRVHNKEAPVTATSNVTAALASSRPAINSHHITDQHVSTSKVVLVL